MEKFLKLVENTTWYIQLLYGAILATFFGSIVLFCGYSLFIALVLIALIAAVREHYNEHLENRFNWRNFFLLLLPIILASYLF